MSALPKLTEGQHNAIALVRVIGILDQHRKTILGRWVNRYLNRLARELMR